MTDPQTLSEFNCFAVAVGGPEKEVSEKSCAITGADPITFGVFSGYFSTDVEIDIEVAPGDLRQIYLLGMKSKTGQPCLNAFDYVTPKSEFSRPQILAQKSMSLRPGPNEVILVPEFKNKFVETCNVGRGVAGKPKIIISNATATESEKMVFDVQLTSEPATTVSVHYETADGTAVSGADYQSTSGVLNFAIGERNAKITVPTINDNLMEASESIQLTLTLGHGYETAGSILSASGMIVDDDSKTKTWNFTDGSANSSDFIFDPKFITFSSTSGVGLRMFDSKIVVAPQFQQGQFRNTHYYNGSLTLAPSASFAFLSADWVPSYSSLAGYWSFENNWQDSSPAGLTLTPVSSPGFITTGQMSGLASAQMDNSFAKWAQTPASASFNTPNQTWIMWVKQTAMGAQSAALVQKDGDFKFLLSNGSTIALNRIANNTSYGGSTYAPNVGAWIQVGFTIDGDQVSYYVNGVRAAQMTVPIISFTSSPVKLGVGLNGSIDEVAHFTSALSPAEIKMIYERQSAKFTGSYESRVFDLLQDVAWPSFDIEARRAYGKEIPLASAESNSYYPAYNGAPFYGVSAAGLLNVWRFNDAPIDSIQSVNGTLGTSTSFGIGLLDKALWLRASSSAFNIPSVNASWKQVPLTISGWIFLEAPGTGQKRTVFASSAQPEVRGLRFGLDTANRLEMVIGDDVGGLRTFSSNAVISTGRWHHVVAVVKSLTATDLYVDGKLATVTSTGSVSGIGGTSSTAVIGFNPAAGGVAFIGRIDELAIWNRALNGIEILDIYLRAALRVKYQVRSCSSADCSGSPFVGPDGTPFSFYSEIQNNTAVTATGQPTGEPRITKFKIDWTTPSHSLMAAPLAARYFQIRAFLESDDEGTACTGGKCFPEIRTIAAGPWIQYASGLHSVELKNPVAASEIASFTQESVNPCARYQLSVDNGASWRYWSGTAWQVATDLTQTTTMSDIQTHLASLSGAPYAFKFRAVLKTTANLSNSCSIYTLDLFYRP